MRYIKFKNLEVDWGSMGCSQKSFYREGSDEGFIVQNGKLFGFRGHENGYKIFSEYCVENDKNFTKEKIENDFFNGVGYQSSPFYRDYWICVENGEVELFDDLSEDLRELETIKIQL